MIASLKGQVERVGGNQIEIVVNGVGYLVSVGEKLVGKITEGIDLKVFTFMSVSENDMSLFGFETRDEVNLFKMLISVSGVGPKTGAQILGKTESEKVIKAIANADVKFFEDIKGIGKKTAQRIIIDLKSRLGSLKELDLSGGEEITEDDLYLSLKQLGFDKKEIEKVMKKLPKDILIIEERLSWCLQNL